MKDECMILIKYTILDGPNILDGFKHNKNFDVGNGIDIIKNDKKYMISILFI